VILDLFRLEGKSGIVTGAGTGIGKAIARGLAEAGARVAIAARNLERLEQAAREFLPVGIPVLPLRVDLRSQESIQSLVDRTIGEFGKIDFLFNSAGAIHRSPSEDYPKEAWEEVLQVNLTGPFLLTQAVARTMIANGIRGKIVNISSLRGVSGGRNVPAYAASKGGINLLTKSMCNDLAPYGIHVNAIGPGWVNTEFTQPIRQDEELYRETILRIPLARWAEPEEIAGIAVFLASDASNYITGQVIYVDGGYLAL